VKPRFGLAILVLCAVWGRGVPIWAWGPRPPRVEVRDGVGYVRVDQAARAAGLQTDRAGLVLGGGGHTLTLTPEHRQARFDRDLVWLHEPVARIGTHWELAEIDLRQVLEPLFRPGVPLRDRAVGRVLLDPGHGGEDRGAEGASALVEKQLTLDVCRRVQARLAEQGIAAELTRTSDRAIPLAGRPRMAADRHADLFISVHFNAAGNRDAAGVETYALTAPGFASTADFGGASGHDAKVYPGHAQAASNTVLAWTVHHNLCRITRAEDRGVRRARFAVLRDAPCPAVLVECGFLTNPAEAARIRLPRYRQGIADGVAAGIREYIRQAQLARAAAE